MEENINHNWIHKIHEKEIWNAIAAYLMIFVSSLFLFNKNKYVNTDFVKWHVKSAILIHLWFLITGVIFIYFSLFSRISVLSLWLNHIIIILIFTFLLGILIMWIYKAKNWQNFAVSKSIHIYKQTKILDIDWNWKITEREKVTIILSLVPFVWFVLFWKYKNNKTIQDSVRVNISLTLTMSLLYIFWYGDLSSLFLLFYIVIITFIWINLFTRNELLQIKFPKILSPENAYISFVTLKNYLKWYVTNKWFNSFVETKKATYEKMKKSEEILLLELKEKKAFTLPKVLLYIPIVNLITIFAKNTNYSVHKANWIMTTLLIITWLVLSYFDILNYRVNILFLFPILFWIWYLNYRLAYRIPVIYNIYKMFAYILWLMKFGTKKINEKRKEENEILLKVKPVNNQQDVVETTEEKTKELTKKLTEIK